jgi:malonyl-CoA O-methyltransferase
MLDRTAIKEAFGRAAPVYDAHAHLQRQVRQHCLALGQAYWPSGKQILDVGCGTGALLTEVSQARLKWHVTSLDLSPGMCAVAKEKSPAVVNADASGMPFADASFDGVFSSLMLQWADNSSIVWQEMARVLKPYGRVVLSTFVHGTLQELRDAFMSLDGKPHVSHFLQAHEILKFASDAGFTLAMAEQVRIVNHYPDAIALMRSLQFIGATHKDANRSRGLMTLKQLASVERNYEKRFGTPDGLPATWQLLCLVLQKI